MEHGTPFCPKCNAPQIRVSPALREEERGRQLEESERKLQPPDSSQPGGPPDSAIDWHLARICAIVAGALLAAVMMVPPLVTFAFIWMPWAGSLAVQLYKRKRPSALVTRGAGARMGVTTGFVAFIALVVFKSAEMAIAVFALHEGPQLAASLRAQVQQAAASNPDPQAQKLIQFFLTPDGLALLAVTGMVFLCFLLLLLCTLGGLLGALIFGKRART